MLIDIFAHRYASVTIFESFGEAERRLIVQGFRILSEQICPYWINGKEHDRGKKYWEDLHSRIAMELGFFSLSNTTYVHNMTWAGKVSTHVGTYTMHDVCKHWMLTAFDGSVSADQYMKERLSLIELGFQLREEELATANAKFAHEVQSAKRHPPQREPGVLRLPGDHTLAREYLNRKINEEFRRCVEELNERFRQAGCNLHYHNEHIQVASDPLLQKEVHSPFWNIISGQKWHNVDNDMKEALDRRDNGVNDAAFYAVRALESTIKIISDEKKLTTGKEKGAHNYIDNISSKKANYINSWEANMLKEIFTQIRNPFGHGPGSEEAPQLTAQQTDWVIDTCMAWIKSLVRRM